MPSYSHSKLTTFEQCKLKYKYKYLDKIPVPSEQTIEAFMGDLVHRTLQKLYTGLLDQNTPTRDELLTYYTTLWDHEWTPTILHANNNHPPGYYKHLGIVQLTTYYEAHAPFTQEKTLAVETDYTLDLGNDITYSIKIDRLTTSQDGVYEVRDYKTGATLPSKETLEHDRQLAMYALWVQKNYPEAQNIRLVWHYLAHNTTLEVMPTREHLNTIKERTLHTIKIIQSTTDFPPQPSRLCNWCPYQSFCPEWNTQSREEQHTNLIDHYTALSNLHTSLLKEFAIIQERLTPHTHSAPSDAQTTPQALTKHHKRALTEEHLWEDFTLAQHTLTTYLTLPNIPEDLKRDIHSLNEKITLFTTLTARAKISL